MATNPIGRYTSNLTANIPKALKEAIAECARDSNLNQSTFVRVILEDAIRREVEVITRYKASAQKNSKALINDVSSIRITNDEGIRIEQQFDHYRNLTHRDYKIANKAE